MIQVSLDSEPPPICRGQKEVKKKKRNLPQMVFSSKNKKNNSNLKSLKTEKLEDKIKNNPASTSSTEDYSSLEKYFSEETINLSQTNLSFSKQSSSEGNIFQNNQEYPNRQQTISDKNSEFYFKNTEYKFNFSQTFIKDNNKENTDYSESREKQEKEPIYILSSFDNEKTTEENIIKWSATVYN